MLLKLRKDCIIPFSRHCESANKLERDFLTSKGELTING